LPGTILAPGIEEECRCPRGRQLRPRHRIRYGGEDSWEIEWIWKQGVLWLGRRVRGFTGDGGCQGPAAVRVSWHSANNGDDSYGSAVLLLDSNDCAEAFPDFHPPIVPVRFGFFHYSIIISLPVFVLNIIDGLQD